MAFDDLEAILGSIHDLHTPVELSPYHWQVLHWPYHPVRAELRLQLGCDLLERLVADCLGSFLSCGFLLLFPDGSLDRDRLDLVLLLLLYKSVHSGCHIGDSLCLGRVT